MQLPVIQDKSKPWVPPQNEPNPVVGKCDKCGLELRAIMMYSCNRQDCPCFPQVRM